MLSKRNMKLLPTFPEPKRQKVHWDFVLDEMVWLAKEFGKCVPFIPSAHFAMLPILVFRANVLWTFWSY